VEKVNIETNKPLGRAKKYFSIREAVVPGASGLPHYCVQFVCVLDFEFAGGLAV